MCYLHEMQCLNSASSQVTSLQGVCCIHSKLEECAVLQNAKMDMLRFKLTKANLKFITQHDANDANTANAADDNADHELF